MKIVYQGQIGIVAGLREEEISAETTNSVSDLVKAVATTKSVEVQKFLIDAQGEVRQSLFAALDGEHVQDYSAAIGGARELLLMPPMAGG